MINSAKHLLIILSIAVSLALANALLPTTLAKGERLLANRAESPNLTATPTATKNFLTPNASTPTVLPPTATPAFTATSTPPFTTTPTTTPTLVPTKPFAYPLFVPVLMNQNIPTLRNGDFEQGNAFWSEYSSLSYRLILERSALQNIPPHGGEWAAWLGGKNNETSALSQQVTIPIDRPVLHYWYSIIAPTDCGADIASILIDDELLEQIHLCRVGNSDWSRRQLDLNAMRGQIVTITFRVDTDRNERHSNFFLDDIGWSTFSEPASTR